MTDLFQNLFHKIIKILKLFFLIFDNGLAKRLFFICLPVGVKQSKKIQKTVAQNWNYC
jgi:hypothetical protein